MIPILFDIEINTDINRFRFYFERIFFFVFADEVVYAESNSLLAENKENNSTKLQLLNTNDSWYKENEVRYFKLSSKLFYL